MTRRAHSTTRRTAARLGAAAGAALAIAVLGPVAIGQETGKEKPSTTAKSAPKKPVKAKPLPPPARKVPADAPSRFPTDI